MALEFIDKIEFDTSAGLKTIQLLYGDLTALSNKEKVDLLLVSAFHGDYTPTTTSLIGALYRNLGLSVGKLAKDKEEDLRKLFHCWWSKPLPDQFPYRRLLCFESGRSGASPYKAVQAIFKALVPACSLFSNGVIVSPLLSTGNQGYSERKMLSAIIDSAVLWMENGLSISTFKLVIYRGSEQILEAFRQMKRKHNRLPGSEMRFKSRRGEAPGPKYDFYLSYVSHSKKNVNRVKQIFLQHQNQLRFFTTEDLMTRSTSEETLQADIFDVMKTCSRVITFLSPAYLEDDDRVEEYNAAWCLNKKRGSTTRIAPMLCETTSGLPSYMSLIQWVDIRVQEGNTDRLVRNITLYLVGYIQEVDGDISIDAADSKTGLAKLENVADEEDDGLRTDEKYDVFVSYAHANEEICKAVVRMLQTQIPNVKLFVDREELRTGGLWQQTLYHALESSTVTLALLSPGYLRSKMCDEEYRLSLARHFTEESFHLVPVQVESADDMPDRYTAVRNSAIGEQQLLNYVEMDLVPSIKACLEDGRCDGIFIPICKTVYNLTALLQDGRCARLPALIETETAFTPTDATRAMKIQVLCSKAKHDSEIGLRIKDHLLTKLGFQAELSIDYDTATVLKKLDDADLIVVLVSSGFLKDADRIEELQIAIKRQRYDKTTKLYPVLISSSLDLSGKYHHVYCELLRYDCCLSDPVWDTLVIDSAMADNPNYNTGMMAELSALQDEYDAKYHDWTIEDSHEEELRMARLEKDFKKKQVKFITTVCNRVAHHMTRLDKTENEVLIDTFEFIKEVVLDQESTKKQELAAIEEIGSKYERSGLESSHQAKGKMPTQNGSKGKENIQNPKDKHMQDGKAKESQACTLL